MNTHVGRPASISTESVLLCREWEGEKDSPFMQSITRSIAIVNPFHWSQLCGLSQVFEIAQKLNELVRKSRLFSLNHMFPLSSCFFSRTCDVFVSLRCSKSRFMILISFVSFSLRKCVEFISHLNCYRRCRRRNQAQSIAEHRSGAKNICAQ